MRHAELTIRLEVGECEYPLDARLQTRLEEGGRGEPDAARGAHRRRTLLQPERRRVRGTILRSVDGHRTLGAQERVIDVDRMLDHAAAENPGVELTITMSSANSPLLPLHARRAVRVVDGVVGSYAGHVYRNCLVND